MLIFRGAVLTILFILLAALPTQFSNAAVFSTGPALTSVENSALIIVAGRKLANDDLQLNIHNVTDELYQSALRNSYDDSDIYYLATDSSLDGYDTMSNLANLESAITEWASQQLQPGGSLSIYMFSYGDPDEFIVDGLSDQTLSPLDLDRWLSTLEGNVADVEINIIIEAGESGSFISAANGKIGGPGRVVITSASDDGPSYDSASDGAIFSDKIITLLNQGNDLKTSFESAKKAAQQEEGRHGLQDPWIDADGDGIHNENEDLDIAFQRKFFNDNRPLTSTPTPTQTPTQMSTTPTRIPTQVPPGVLGDDCGQAIQVPIDGLFHEKGFENRADSKWFTFDGVEEKKYQIDIQVPSGSGADISLELYPECDRSPTRVPRSFNSGVRTTFTSPNNEPIYLYVSNLDTRETFSDLSYEISIQEIQPPGPKGAVIIVAGLLYENDSLQDNIHKTTERVFEMYQKRGYTADDIYYLATDSTLVGYDEPATVGNLRDGITRWAVDRIKDEAISDVLTIYMMDHGNVDKLYLDGRNNEVLIPNQLDEWLSTLETSVPGVKINVIIEACQSGSFIKEPGSISRPGRIIVTSSSQEEDAFASRDGAYFSDIFLTRISQGENLFSSWWKTQDTVQDLIQQLGSDYRQTPWIDGNGNGRHNEPEDFAEAAARGFGTQTLTFDTSDEAYITDVDISENVITAEVRTDIDTGDSDKDVWAVLYPPSYDIPNPENEMIGQPEENTITLESKGNNSYQGRFNFTEAGTYRIVVHAVSEGGLSALPKVITFDSPGTAGVEGSDQGTMVYLPFMSR